MNFWKFPTAGIVESIEQFWRIHITAVSGTVVLQKQIYASLTSVIDVCVEKKHTKKLSDLKVTQFFVGLFRPNALQLSFFGAKLKFS